MKNYKAVPLFFIFFFISLSPVLCQYEFIGQMNLNKSSAKVDPLGNIYSFDDHEIIKYSEMGESPMSFSSTAFGSIYDIDVSNPLRILVFFKDFQQILFLDQSLSPIGQTISLTDLDLNQVSEACSSPQNGFWVYSGSAYQLIHVNQNLSKDFTSLRFDRFVNEPWNLLSMEEENGMVFLGFKKNDMLVMDRYANFLEKIHFDSLRAFQALPKRLCVLSEREMVFHDLQTGERTSTALPMISQIEYFYWLNNDLYLYSDNTVKIYKASK